ncbi:RING finger protein 150 [Nymphon striatum]|nr:RING finger protein 150 [Nymphon striatum]
MMSLHTEVEAVLFIHQWDETDPPIAGILHQDLTMKNFVSIFITKMKGEEMSTLIENGTKVTMYITVGTHTTYRYANINRTSVLFVSISFIVLMVISLAWLVFYYIQRFRYIHAKDLLARRLSSAAKKALTKIPVKSLKVGDRETDSDFECCAVCIERYFLSDIVRTLPCKHTFHKSCVDPWLLDQRTCPMCKMDILKFYGLIVSSAINCGVEFIPFPKPKRNLETCKRWIKACGRPHEQLNISVDDGNYHLYVCTKFSSSQDSVINLDMDGTIHQYPRIDRHHRSDSLDDVIIFSDVRRSSNRSNDFVILEEAVLVQLLDLPDHCKKECGEECRTLLDTEAQSDVEDINSNIANHHSLQSTFQAESPLPESESLIDGEENTHEATAVQSTSHDLLVILNSPTSEAGGFSNMTA